MSTVEKQAHILDQNNILISTALYPRFTLFLFTKQLVGFHLQCIRSSTV